MARLNHIGIAVSDPARVKRLFEILGIQEESSESVPDQGVRVHFLPTDSGVTNLELLEVQDPQSPVAQFIQKKGPGIHHLAFEVKTGTLEAVSESLKKEGFRLIYGEPKAGAHGMKINFIHPATTGGMLIEVLEHPNAHKTHKGR